MSCTLPSTKLEAATTCANRLQIRGSSSCVTPQTSSKIPLLQVLPERGPDSGFTKSTAVLHFSFLVMMLI